MKNPIVSIRDIDHHHSRANERMFNSSGTLMSSSMQSAENTYSKHQTDS